MAETKKTILTQEGYDKLVQELEYLKTVRRNEISDQIAFARGFGDLSENAEYDEAKNEQSRNETKITELENMLHNCEIAEATSKGVVGIGDTVAVKYVDKGNTREFTLVGANETDPRNGKINSDSPIGSALMGKKKNQIVEAITPAGTIRLQIVGIQKPSVK